MSMPTPNDSSERAQPDRYSRQVRYTPLGSQGQARLLAGRALVCGCGALGSVIASTLVRGGVGFVRIVDRDFLELNNLQRQVLFDEQDVASGLPKAVAAATKLRQINSEVEIEAVVADVDHTNVEQLAAGMHVIVDGTDNFETRFLVNDVSIKHRIPWVYGGCIGAEGQTMTIVPGQSACLRCLMAEPPPPGVTPTCDTAGIMSPVVNLIASIEAMEAIKILSGNTEAVSPWLTVVDLWENRLRQISVAALREQSDCAACRREEFSFLAGTRSTAGAVLCGRDAVQLSPQTGATLSLAALAAKLEGIGAVTLNPYLLRLVVDGYAFTIFVDGRAIVSGTDDIATARTLYARYIGM